MSETPTMSQDDLMNRLNDVLTGAETSVALGALTTLALRGFCLLRIHGDDPGQREWMKSVGERFITLANIHPDAVRETAEFLSD